MRGGVLSGGEAVSAAERLRRVDPDPAVYGALVEAGFESALEIAHLSEPRFVMQIADRLGGDEERARRVHGRARQISSAVMHAFANVHTAIRDPQFNALKVRTTGEETQAAFDALPSYEELFGSLDYCECEECRSIFGAAAYLVDLLRIVDEHVGQPSGDFAFATRRPDIGGIELTCANTNETFPMLRVVCERLEALAAEYLGKPADLFEALAGATYPFELPFDLPWATVTLYLEQIEVSLVEVYSAFGAGATDVARARFDLSLALLGFVLEPLASEPKALATSYGVAETELAGLAQVPKFLTATGLELEGLLSLLEQGLSEAEIEHGVAAGFFINGGVAGKGLKYEPGNSKTSKPATIAGLAAAPADPLDRISRFVRLAARLGWDYATLDWALRAAGDGSAAITPASVAALGAFDELAAATGLGTIDACALVGPLKPYGAEEGPTPFDAAFNDPSVVGADVYQPQTPLNPTYGSTVRPWAPGSAEPKQRALTTRLAAATGLPLGEVTALGAALFGSGATNLSYEALCAVYRHGLLVRTLGMTVAEYLTLMGLLGHVSAEKLSETLALADVQKIVERGAWLAGSGLTLDQIDYFLGAEASATVDPLFQVAALPEWMASVRASAGNLEGPARDAELMRQLGALFGVAPDLIEALAASAKAAADEAAPLPSGVSWEQAFLKPPEPSQPPPYLAYVTAYVTTLSRWLVLAGALSAPPELVTAATKAPAAFGIASPPNLESVYWLATFQQLSNLYGDRSGRLIAFADPGSQKPPADPAGQLAAATGWDPGQVSILLAAYSSQANKVLVLQALVRQFGLLRKLGADSALASRLVSVSCSGEATWEERQALAALVVATVRARVADEKWEAISVQLDGALQELRRDALAPLVLAHLRSAHEQIETLDNLSEYLLIDVETSAAPQISRVREALNAVQLYLQRCRLQVEPITELAIPEAWWEWIASYRVWEANRQVFLYPENYLDPSLRKDKTKLFAALETTLQQGEVTEEAVDAAFRTYVDGLVKLASLEYVDAYRCTVNDAERGPLDTTFLFARTATDPYEYYSISYQEGVWGSWQPIAVTIPAPVVTPVYAFNRLFLFWVELKVAKDAQIQQQASSQGVAYEATIKYSFTNFNEDWIQPQALVEDEVVYYMPAPDDQAGALGELKERIDLFEMDALSWQRVSVTVVEPEPGATAPDPSGEKLVVMYGPFLEVADGTKGLTEPTKPPEPLANQGSPAQQFERRLFQILTTFDQLVGSGAYGYMSLIEPIVLDHQLNPSYVRRANEVVVAETDLRENAPPLVKPEIESVLGSLALASSDCAYVANASADSAPSVATTRPPLPVTEESFITGPIGTTVAATAWTQLGAHGIVEKGVVAKSFTGTTDLSFLVAAGVPEGDVPTIRSVLLEAMGDPTLFATVPVKTAAVIAVKNRPGSFVLSVGDEAFLLTPHDVEYADLALSTSSAPIESSPLVFDSYFKPISATRYTAIFKDLVGHHLVTELDEHVGLLSPVFDARTNLEEMFSGAPPAEHAALVAQLRRILLALPSLTLLSYDDSSMPRFVLPTSFVTPQITTAVSEQAFKDLVANGFIDESGRLIVEVNATTDLKEILAGAPESIREEIRAVLMRMPKFVQHSSFATKNISVKVSEEVFGQLESHGVIDASGAVSPSFGPATDLTFLFASAKEPTRGVLTGEVRAVLEQFFASTYRVDSNEIGFEVERISARSSSREMAYALFAGGVEAALSLETQDAPVVAKLPFGRLGPSLASISPPPLLDGAQIDFEGPFGLYYWELFYHAPMLVASTLAANQKFEAAKKWIEYVLDPTAAEQLVEPQSFVTPDIGPTTAASAFAALVSQGVLVEVDPKSARVAPSYTPQTSLGPFFASLPEEVVDQYRAVLANHQLSTPPGHYWQFRPFRTQTLETLLETLTSKTQIATYEDDPFDPDAIARLRIGAYEKATVMRYVDLLVAWGDMLFTQYTWESVTSATLLYMYAEDLLGPRPVDLGPSPSPASELSFDQIKEKYAGAPIPQFLIDLEGSLGAIGGVSSLNPPGTPFNAIDAYFCVPSNSRLGSHWDTVEDRLTKIRKGENIAGVPTPLALFDPPLEPMALVRASASGAGFPAAAGGAAAKPKSDYRFGALYEQAVQLASGVKDLGAGLLAALEKQDATALEALRNTQETAVLDLMTALKERQIADLEATVESLQRQHDKAKFTADHYSGLATAGLSSQERTTQQLDEAAIAFQALAVPIHGISIAGYLAPSIFGLADGGMQFGDAVNAGAEIAASTSQTLSLGAGLSASTAEFDRRGEDWEFQAQSATRDAEICEKQIEAANQQLAGARQDLAVHLRSIEQAEAVSRFLTSRFTNTDLYTWMVGRLSALYFQSYTAAAEAARAAELAYQFEQNASDSYVDYEYWDSLHRGLCAGENLLQSLARLKHAYVEANQRKLEIEKTISLRQLDPTQIQALREGKPATFAITETMLDFDFPGHYARQIMSVAVTIPSLVGPYQNVNAVLRQEKNTVVTAASPEVVNYLVELDAGETPTKTPTSGLREGWLPEQEIAVTRGSDDNGVYRLDFGGERFMPFEGTGAISRWMLAIPPENNRIDLSQLTDVIFELRYNALDGGSTFEGEPSFRTNVIKTLREHKARLGGKLYLDGAQMFPSAWYAFMHPQPDPATQELAWELEPAMFPYAPSMRLDQVSVKIDVADTVTSTDSTKFVVLKIGSATFPLEFKGGYAVVESLGAAATDFLGPWSLVVTLAESPDPHLVSGGQLDAEALLDFELVLNWSADVLPKGKQS
jgi:Tc toxin complex TcA C-terminal TcB-binding domain/Neuraminidase-like domain/Salmonella virulence plasmid 28.1kDa A protein